MATAEEPERGERAGRRCDLGCQSWPDEALYSKCPICGEPTDRYSNLTPISHEEAQSILLHVEFDRYYDERCAKLGIPSDGPLPPEYERALPPPAALLD